MHEIASNVRLIFYGDADKTNRPKKQIAIMTLHSPHCIAFNKINIFPWNCCKMISWAKNYEIHAILMRINTYLFNKTMLSANEIYESIQIKKG